MNTEADVIQLLEQADQQIDIRWCPTMLNPRRRGSVSSEWVTIEFSTLDQLPGAISKLFATLRERKNG
jgi:hypothetical protein